MNLRHIYIIVLLFFTSLSVNAQSEARYRAVEEAFANTLHKYTAHVADTIAEHLVKKNKKNPAICVALARGYFRDREIDRAHKYLEKALKISPKYGPAYEAYGDIENYYLRYDSAAYYYAQAIEKNPEYTKVYSKYAKIVGKTDPEKAVAVLQQARNYDKKYNSDVESANVWFSAEGIGNQTQLDKTLEYFAKSDTIKMTKYDLGNYALAEWMTQNYNRSLEICNYGLSRFPGFLTLARVRFYDEVDRKNYDAVEPAADYLFNQVDSVDSTTYISRDYFYYAKYYVVKQDIKNASRQIAYIYKCNDDDAMAMRDNSNKLIQAYTDSLKMAGDYARAEEDWKTFITVGRPQDLDNSYYYYLLSTTYQEQINAVEADTTITNKQATIDRLADELDGVYAYLQDKYPAFETELMAYLRAVNQRHFDDDHFTLGTAEPYYRHVIEVVEPIREKTKRHITYLAGAYDYMAIYYFYRDDKKRALTYANKVLSVEPDNANAKQIVNFMSRRK